MPDGASADSASVLAARESEHQPPRPTRRKRLRCDGRGWCQSSFIGPASFRRVPTRHISVPSSRALLDTPPSRLPCASTRRQPSPPRTRHARSRMSRRRRRCIRWGVIPDRSRSAIAMDRSRSDCRRVSRCHGLGHRRSTGGDAGKLSTCWAARRRSATERRGSG